MKRNSIERYVGKTNDTQVIVIEQASRNIGFNLQGSGDPN